MKIKNIILALSISLILVATGCTSRNKGEWGPTFGSFRLHVSDKPLHAFYTDVYSKNKEDKIILAFLDNSLVPAYINTSKDFPNISWYISKPNLHPLDRIECVGKFDKTGKGTIDIGGKTFNISNGRLFLINTDKKPLKVIQINEQFNSPPFNDLPRSYTISSDNRLVFKKPLIPLLLYEQKFECLLKNNKKVVAFLANVRKNSEKNKSEEKKKSAPKRQSNRETKIDYNNESKKLKNVDLKDNKDNPLILSYIGNFKNTKRTFHLVLKDNVIQCAYISTEKDSTTWSLTELDSTSVMIKYFNEFDETDKGTVDIAGKSFNVSNGRLFMINPNEKPPKVIQVNEQFNLPPSNDASTNHYYSKMKNWFLSCQQKIKYLVKNNKKVAAFFADNKKKLESSPNKSNDLKKKD